MDLVPSKRMGRGRGYNITGDGDILAEFKGEKIDLRHFGTNDTEGADGGYINRAMEVDSDEEDVGSERAESVHNNDKVNSDEFERDDEEVGTDEARNNTSPMDNNVSQSSTDDIDTEERLHSLTYEPSSSKFRNEAIETEERKDSTADGLHTLVSNSERVSNKSGVNISSHKKGGTAHASLGGPQYTELSRLLGMVTTSGIVECAAFISLDGIPEATSTGFALTKSEGMSIICAIQGGYNGLTRIRINGKDFTCSRNRKEERLVGMSEYYFLCAFKIKQFILVAISDTEKQKSSISEITRMLNGYLSGHSSS